MPPDCYEQNSFKNLYINFKEEEIPVKEKNSEVCYIQIWSLEEGTFRIFLFVVISWKHFQYASKSVHTPISN